MTQTTDQKHKQIHLSFATGLMEALQKAATAERRSRNDLLRIILEDWLTERGYLPPRD
jgi:hypothetical protein